MQQTAVSYACIATREFVCAPIFLDEYSVPACGLTDVSPSQIMKNKRLWSSQISAPALPL